MEIPGGDEEEKPLDDPAGVLTAAALGGLVLVVGPLPVNPEDAGVIGFAVMAQVADRPVDSRGALDDQATEAAGTAQASAVGASAQHRLVGGSDVYLRGA